MPLLGRPLPRLRTQCCRGLFPQVTGPAASRMLAFLTPARVSKSFHRGQHRLGQAPSEGKQTEASDRACRSIPSSKRCGDLRGRDESTQGGGENVSRGHILAGFPAPRGGSPRKQTQCAKVQGKSRVVRASSGVGRAPEAAAEQDWCSSASTQPPPRTHQKQAPPLLSEHRWERTEAGRGACREDRGGGRGEET